MAVRTKSVCTESQTRKNIIIIANFCGSLNGRDNNRFLYLAEILGQDCDVEIVTSDFDHARKKHRKHIEKRYPYIVTQLHEPGYSKNVCLKRFLSHWIWGRNVNKYLRSRKKPDIVYSAVPSLTGAYEATQYCKKNGIKFIVDVQDLWPEAFGMVFKVPIISNIIFAPFKWQANKIYGSADEIIAVSQSYVDRALSVNKNCGEGYAVFLGTQLDTFDENAKKNAIKVKPSDELWLGYCGTLGSSYDLICVFDALEIIAGYGMKPPKFIIMGDGPRRREFEDYSKRKKINCEFTGMLPYDEMCGILAACDIVVNPITHGAAGSIINKHADYAASGLPVLNTQECEEYGNLINNYQMGFNCKNNDAKNLAENMIRLIQDDRLREKMGRNARKCAEEKFNRKCCYNEILRLVKA